MPHGFKVVINNDKINLIYRLRLSVANSPLGQTLLSIGERLFVMKMETIDIPSLTQDQLKIFWSRVEAKGPDECWEWKGTIQDFGYGLFPLNGLQLRTHRVMWFIKHGKIPDGMFVCHHCDNPPCVNPSHLFLGTYLKNIQDKVEKGRNPHGENHYATELTPEQVMEIRQINGSRKWGTGYRALAKKYGVSRSIIRDAAKEITWKDLNPAKPINSR